MPRPLTSTLLSLLLLAAAVPARAQGTETTLDSAAVAKEDSSGQSGHNWLVALLRKIARRSDDSTATDPAGGDDADNVAPARPARRLFNSRKDSVAYESARAA